MMPASLLKVKGGGRLIQNLYYTCNLNSLLLISLYFHFTFLHAPKKFGEEGLQFNGNLIFYMCKFKKNVML